MERARLRALTPVSLLIIFSSSNVEMERARLRALTRFPPRLRNLRSILVEMERARLRALTHVFPYLLPNLSAKDYRWGYETAISAQSDRPIDYKINERSIPVGFNRPGIIFDYHLMPLTSQVRNFMLGRRTQRVML